MAEETATPAAPAASTPADATLLDAPESKSTGADEANGSLLDTKATDSTPNGQDASSEAKKTGADSKATDKPADKPAVPEQYADPKLPEGLVLDPAIKQKFDVAAKTLGLSQDQYQQLVDIQAELTTKHTAAVMDQYQKTVQGWTDETKKILGPDPDSALRVAAKAIDRIFPDPTENKEFRDMMRDTGLGNWKLMVKAFQFVGKAISEDGFVEGKPNSTPSKSAARVIFDHPTSQAAMDFDK